MENAIAAQPYAALESPATKNPISTILSTKRSQSIFFSAVVGGMAAACRTVMYRNHTTCHQ